MSLSDLSDLSDLSSDEDDLPLTKSTQKPAKNVKSKEYQITHTLRPPRTTQYTTKSLYDQIIDNTIDLDPEYQRDVVWTEQKQSGIIDSILRNYYIPPVIFAVSSSDDGSELRTCIDGKQRLTSIQRFMDGLIPYKDSFTNQKMWFKQVGKTRRKLLPKGYMQAFTNKQIVCVEYENLTGDQEREIFQRVQLGVALTPAERMQALTGPWPSLIRELQDEVEPGFEGHLDWANGRGRNFQCLATVAYLIDKSTRAMPAAPQLEKWLQEAGPISSQFKNGLFNTFHVFIDLVHAFGDIFRKPAKLAPMEFVMVGFLVHLHKTKLSPTQLSSAIKKMRADVRMKHEDIRLNGKVHKSMFLFISKQVKASELKSDMKGDKPAASRARLSQINKTMKRKRKADTDEESSESEPTQPPPSKSTTSRTVAGSNRAPAVGSSNAKIPAKSKASVKRSSISQPSQPIAKPAMPPTESKSSLISKPSLPRISKDFNEAADTPSQTTIPPSIQQKQSMPSVRVLPSAAQQPPVKREASLPPTSMAPTIDRLGPIRAIKAASSTPTQSPTTPAGFPNGIYTDGKSQPVQDPRRPQVRTSFDNALQQSQQSPWSASQSPVVAPPVFPTGMPLDQNQLQVLLARAGITQLQNQSSSQGPYLHQNGAPNGADQQSPNVPFSGRSSNAPPVPQAPGFVQASNNSFYSQPAASNLNEQGNTQVSNASASSPGLPLQTVWPARNDMTPLTNGSANSAPTSSQTTPSIPPPPTSSSSTMSGLPYPPTSASSAGSTPWYGHLDQVKSEERRGSNFSARRDPDYYPRPQERSRDSRSYDLGRGLDRDRDRDRERDRRYISAPYRERGRSRSRSRERDSGWNKGWGNSKNRYDPR